MASEFSELTAFPPFGLKSQRTSIKPGRHLAAGTSEPPNVAQQETENDLDAQKKNKVNGNNLTSWFKYIITTSLSGFSASRLPLSRNDATSMPASRTESGTSVSTPPPRGDPSPH